MSRDLLLSCIVALELALAACGVEPSVGVDAPTDLASELTFDPTTLAFPHPFILGSTTTTGWPFIGTLDD
jgi:hypothetical protein